MAQTRATSLRSTTLAGSENPMPIGKEANNVKTRAMATRTALGNIGNNVQPKPQQNKALKPVKPERSLAPSGLSRQKATLNLPSEVTRVTRSKSSLPFDDVDNVEAMEVDAEVIKLTSTDPKVENIDVDDYGNPQMASEYVNEIYAYMRQLEAEQNVKENYLEALNVDNKLAIKPKMRNLLVDWLVEVHMQFSLLQETLYMTVAILDRFLQEKATEVSTKQLQLVGISAMFIASKYEEMYPPEIGDFVYISDHTYKAHEIRKMEIKIMATLQFDLGRPLPLNFLRRNSKAGFVDSKAHGLAKYVMELGLVEYKMAHIAPSLLAAASLAFAMRVLAENEDRTLVDLWNPTLGHYSAYQVDELAPVVGQLSEVVFAVSTADDSDGKKKLRAVHKKYANKKFMKIALLPELKAEKVRSMARGEI